MNLKDQLRTDLTAAMKAKDTTALRTLRVVLAAVGAAEVAGDARIELSDDQVLAVLASEAKKRPMPTPVVAATSKPRPSAPKVRSSPGTSRPR